MGVAMETPIDFNRPFSREVLQDWWAWQRNNHDVRVPNIWLAHQDSLDLWFHMFSASYADNPQYLERLVQACVTHKPWSFNDFCTTLMYWDQHRNFLSDIDLMRHLLPIFATRSPIFCRAVAVSGLAQGGATQMHAQVVVHALEHWNTVNSVSTDPLIWEASWDFLKMQSNPHAPGTIVDYLSQFFSLHDFLTLVLPPGQTRMHEGSLQAFKNRQGLFRLFDVFENQTLRPTLKALSVLRQWPQHRIAHNDIATLEHVYTHLQNHKDWGRHTEDEWIVRDWLTHLHLWKHLDEQDDAGDNKGRRKM